MSADGAIELDWADGTHRFRLPLAQLCELQEKVNAWRARINVPAVGPRGLLEQLSALDAWPSDVAEVLRLGLIGGIRPGDDMTPTKAMTLVKRYVEDRPLAESSLVAQAVLAAAIVGVPGDRVGKKERGRRKPKATTAASPSPSSTGPVLQ